MQLIQLDMEAIECPTDMPGLISNMIHIEAIIDGATVIAFIDTRAAMNICTCKIAYQIYENREAMFREGASHLLSLTAFGGIKVKLYETFLAAEVMVGGKTFDQLFFVVDSDQHDVLQGLPAITAAGMRLVTAGGENLLPDPSTTLTLDLT